MSEIVVDFKMKLLVNIKNDGNIQKLLAYQKRQVCC